MYLKLFLNLYIRININFEKLILICTTYNVHLLELLNYYYYHFYLQLLNYYYFYKLQFIY